ncbi:MAG: putative ABC transport system permease protein [Chloroflexi bacterium]|nr:MAG: putative ABC transport system permease protein [Chloroflexota bacterium]
MLDVAFAQILQKKLRSLLTVMGFGFCVNLYIVVTTVMRFITEDLDLQVERFRGLLLVQSRGPEGSTGMEWPPISSAITEQEARQVLTTARIHPQESTPVVFAGLAPPLFPTAPPEALIVGLDTGHESAFLGDAPAILGSNRLIPGDRQDQVILGVLAARYFAQHASGTVELPSPVGPISLAAVGSVIPIRGRDFTVLGIIEPETNQLLRSCVVMPLPAAQQVMRQEGAVSALLLTPQSTRDIAPVKQAVEAAHPDLMVVTEEQLAENAGKLLDRVTQLFNVVRWTSVSVAALLITIVMFVAVLERTRELGTLRAIGAPAGSIFTMIMAESLLISSAGAAMGVPMSRVVIRKALGPDAVGIRSRRIEVLAIALLTSFGLTASLVPALRAVRVDPIVALRYE